MIIDVSKGMMNFSQRNNALKPLESCNVTSMVMAFSYLHFNFPKGEHEQPEDNLRSFIEGHNKSPENHGVLSEYTNRWIGQKVCQFSERVKISDILRDLLQGKPVVISGNFPGYPSPLRRPLGHIVCLVGAEWQGKDWIGPPDFVLWDDPYGDTLGDWKGSGNNIKVSYRQFIEWIKPVNDPCVKWAHRFLQAA
jgi:hypothetical protein